MIESIGIVSSAVVPFFNIPLILRIRKRKSADDLSMIWTLGVWISTILMLPAGLISASLAFQVFCVSNFALFSVVVAHVFWYKFARGAPERQYAKSPLSGRSGSR